MGPSLSLPSQHPQHTKMQREQGLCNKNLLWKEGQMEIQVLSSYLFHVLLGNNDPRAE